jgi:hypothetical protein
MNCVRSFTDLKQQGQLHYEPACQEDIKVGRYKGRQVPEFRVSLGHREFRPRSRPRPRPKCGRNGNSRAGYHPAILLPVLVLAVSKNQGAGIMGGWDSERLIHGIIKREPRVMSKLIYIKNWALICKR